MARTYKLDYFTKGTGATVVPNDAPADAPSETEKLNTVRVPREPRKPKSKGAKVTTPLPAGHVRKKATGEIGKVRAVDPKAGTVTVFWLKRGAESTVPLVDVSRR